ncbi:LysR family transcriptional regulator [Pseudomonas chlororaphis]|nr:LysR family transcriptional regulator [Pseudomonas chlororaphis]
MSTVPPLSCLRSFEAVARLGSVTLAAKELHVTHSAISQQIKVLEDLVGINLFIREGRGLRVNEHGRLYSLQIRQSLGAIAEATHLVQARPKASELVVAVMPSFGRSWLLPRIGRFQQHYPHITVRLHASLTVSNLLQESVDIGVRMGRGDWEGLEKRLMFHDDMVVVAAPDFNGGQLPTTPAEIVASTIIFTMDSWQPWCEVAGLLDVNVPRAGLCSNDSNLVLEAVRLRQGIALVRRSLVYDAIVRGELVQLTEYAAPYAYPYWLVLPVQEHLEAKQHQFSAWLFAEVERYVEEVEQLRELQRGF